MKHKNGFTLSETLIVVIVLCIIATLTIPALVNKNKESVAKTKVRKAMAAYESALNKMIIENDLRSNETLDTWANAVNNCGNPSNYFKKVQGDGCIFKTSDGIWWDISNIERPLIAFNQDNLTPAKANDTNDKTAFVLVGRFGNDGSLRVDDLAYETANSVDDTYGNASKAQVEKLYTLLGLKSNNADGGDEPQSIFSSCDPNQLTCTIDGIEYTRGIVEEDTYWTVNKGGNKTWEDAKSSCAEGTHLGTRAELEALHKSGDIKCQDVSVYCKFWTAEEHDPDAVFYFSPNYGVGIVNKAVSADNVQVLCLGN